MSAPGDSPFADALVVFDLDGTLIDSRRDLAESVNALIVERGGTALPVDAVTAMVGEGARLLVARALAAASRDGDVDEAVARFLDIYDQRLLIHTRLYPGTLEMLEAVARTATLAILTNKPQRPTERILEGLGIAAYFAAVVGGDSVFGRKPDPAGLRHLMSRAGVLAAQTILVGDSPIDWRTARAAGTRVCLVRYGFGFPLAAGLLTGDELLAVAPSDIPHLVRPRL
jgi:phosphoglycolate phosphatase